MKRAIYLIFQLTGTYHFASSMQQKNNNRMQRTTVYLIAIVLNILCISTAFAQQKEDNTTTERVYLSGKGSDDTVEWDFFCTDGQNSGKWTKIGVPSCWEQQGFGSYNYGIYFYGKETDPAIPKEQGKYKYEFDVPKAWENKNIQIVFEASMTDTEVRINGKKAGPTHQGAFYRFKYDIGSWLKFGKSNLLEVTVSKESENPSVNLAERRADYWNFGGIFRPVFLEVKPAQNIDRTAINAEADGSFYADVFFGYALDDSYTVKCELFDSKGKKVGKDITAAVTAGRDKAILKGQFENVALWTAETPNLYTTQISLLQNGKTIHTVSDKIGFRTFEIRKKDGLYLNGQRIIMRGVNRHSFWPETGRTLNKTQNYNDVRLIKEMNMNAVRMAHYPPDPEFLEACDELGLYVLNELGGWHGHYDTAVGRKLVKEMVTRDVNHPSILLWDNGNEGGWNTELDNEFALYDPQNRPVIHPQQDLNGMETMHYRSYGETQEYLRGKDLFMPTEFLHGLYDGGHGAGLYDYWKMMYNHPNCTGGFLWVYADEGVVRTDLNGKIDNDGNHGADGIVGPHHEKEGSFFTIKQVWCPVQVEPEVLPEIFSGELSLENRYDFTNLNECAFNWYLKSFSSFDDVQKSEKVTAKGTIKGPDVAPHEKGSIKIPMPSNLQNATGLYLEAVDKNGKELWTWSWNINSQNDLTFKPKENAFNSEVKEDILSIKSDNKTYTFNTLTGHLTGINQNNKILSFGKGPTFIAARRGDRSLDGWVAENLPDKLDGIDRRYDEIKVDGSLTDFTYEEKDSHYEINASYEGALMKATWKIYADGNITLDYQYRYEGVVELMGIKFDYPEEKMKSIKWLGKGPYRVWQNRLRGTTLGIWENDYNDPIPAESFNYPEFKGYFRDWRWADFKTEEGTISIGNKDSNTYLGVYTPRDGRDALLYTLPQTGIAVFNVIPAVRNKVNATDLCGPSSQAQHVSGVYSGTIYLNFRFE